MPLSVDWITNVIFIPQSYLSLAPDGIYDLDVDAFRLDLDTIEASAEGMPFPDTHRHVTETVLSGFTYARLVEILDPYTVEFEDGQYSVRSAGANHNILDVKVANQVSLAVQNSAGLVNSPQLAFSSFQNAVWVDVVNGQAGTGKGQSGFQIGTKKEPVDNFTDALTIGSDNGLNRLMLVGPSFTLGESLDFSDLFIIGQGQHRTAVTVEASANVSGVFFQDVDMDGTLDGDVSCFRCFLRDLDMVSGFLQFCGHKGTITLTAGELIMHSCYDAVAGVGIPTIDCGGSGTAVILRDCRGAFQFINKTGPEEVSIDLVGRVLADATVTAASGDFIVRGIGHTETSASGAVFDITDLVSSPYEVRQGWVDDAANSRMEFEVQLIRNAQFESATGGTLDLDILVAGSVVHSQSGITPDAEGMFRGTVTRVQFSPTTADNFVARAVVTTATGKVYTSTYPVSVI